MIRFLFNDEPVTLEQNAPEQTVLEYLRTISMHRGTKEGCASGDCGACTVVVASAITTHEGEPQLHYASLNSCITFLGTLHGKQLLTVEHLANAGQLHPVQQALADHHGSQCGFCTPGFIMSMFALYKNAAHEPIDRAGVERALAGNLCRCTGYRPIIDAALSLAQLSPEDPFKSAEAATAQALLEIRRQHPQGALTLGDRHFFAPTDSDTLAQLLQQYPGAQLVAGGTDLALSVTQQLQQPGVLIYTGNVAGMDRVEQQPDRLLIGGAVSYSALEPVLKRTLPEFAALLDRLGSLQIRNQGTLAGNVANASPIGDTPPVLLALDARLHLRCGEQRSVVAIDDFFTGYRQTLLPAGGFIEQIEIPLRAGCYHRVYKVSKRLDDDISAVCAAINLTLDDAGVVTAARLGFGGMAATPARARHAEQALIGQPFSESGIQAAQQALLQDFSPIDDVRASAAYRRQVAQNLLLRAVLERGKADSDVLEVVHYA